MADKIRDTTIGIDWKINTSSLSKANQLTDDLIQKGAKVTQSATGAASGYKDIEQSVKGATKEVDKHSRSVDNSSGKVVQFSKKSKEAFQITKKGANNAKESVEDLGGSVDKSNKRIEVLADSSAKASAKISNGLSKAKIAAGVLAASIIAIGKKSFDYASDTNEALNKVEVAFDGNDKAVKKWSESTLKNIGLARGTALDLAAGYGDMATSMGINTEEASKMSTSMVDLAGDLASFKNMSTDRVNTALNGIFTGETESLKGLGIVMTQTNLQQYALEKGYLSTTESATESAKKAVALERAQINLNEATKKYGINSLEAREAQVKLSEAQEKSNEAATSALNELKQDEIVRLRYNYVMDKTKNAHGDFARTGADAANASRVFQQSLIELQDKIGQKILPIFTPLILKANDFIAKYGDEIPRKIGSAINTIKPYATTLFNGAKEGFDNYIKPPLLWLKEYSEKNPDRMKSIAKYAGIAVTGLLAFKLVGSPIVNITKKIWKLTKATSGLTNSLKSPLLEKFGKLKSGTSWLLQGGAQNVVKTSMANSGVQSLMAETALKSSGGLFSKIGLISKGVGTTLSSGGLKGFVKAIPGLSWITAGMNLIGTNKKNVGEKVGGSGGQLAGGALGSIIGSFIAPGIGTAIGGAIGTFVGDKLGKTLGRTVQDNWPKIKETAKGLWDAAKTNIFIGPMVQGIEASAKSLFAFPGEVIDFFSDPFKNSGKINAKKDGVSKESAKNVNSYLEENEKVENVRMDTRVSGQMASVEDFNAMMSTVDKMSQQVIDAHSAKNEKSNTDLDTLKERGILSAGTVASAKNLDEKHTNMEIKEHQDTVQQIKDLETKQRNETIAATKEYEDRILAIKAQASQEKRDLTELELSSISALEMDMRVATRNIEEKFAEESAALENKKKEQAVEALSSSAKDQIRILGKLQADSSEISAKQAADIVASSYKSKDEIIKNADETYEDSIAILEEQRFVYGNITQAQYEDGIKAAKKERDEVVSEAEGRHSEVVRHAQEQAQEHLNEVDWETGETLSKWDQFKISFGDIRTSINDGAIKGFRDLGTALDNIWGGITSAASTAWNGVGNVISGAVNLIIKGINGVTSLWGGKQIAEWNFGGSGGTVSQGKVVGSSNAMIMNYRGSNTSYSGPSLVGEEGVELAYDKSSSTARLIGSNGPEITHIKASERILNHMQTKSVLSGGMGSGEVLPGFASGKGNDKGIIEKATDFISSGVDKAKDVASNAIEWLSDPIGNIANYVNEINPFKNTGLATDEVGGGLLKKFGSNAADWIKSKADEMGSFFGGEASGAGAYAPHFPNPPFVLTSGMGPRWGTNHNGYDYGAPDGTPLPAQHGGKVSYAGTASGYGNLVAIQVANDLHTLYGHMNSIGTSVGKSVKTGQIIGQVGNTGQSTGPHVHYQLNKGGVFGTALDPMTYGAQVESAGAGSGGSVERWRTVIMKALQMNGLPTSSVYVDAWLRQVQSESGGNEKITQSNAVWDVNTAAGNPARGLLQTIPQTFNAYKHQGYNDIYNGFHNALAAINYAKNRYGTTGMLGVIGHGHGYAKGGRPSKGETVLVGENGPELFEADTAGTVHSYDKTKGLFKNASQGINYCPTVNIEVNGDSNDNQSISSRIKEEVEKALEAQYQKLKVLLNLGGVI